MDETEKMTALKKAYAEIILNTAKEAAARIMSSERKAHQFHHDLSSTKEEALHLLLRLKQTMDAKINEAEMKSLSQQKRIEELEAQLQEAEDIVSNLRTELNDAHMKLEEMAISQINQVPNMTETPYNEEGSKQPDKGLSKAIFDANINSIKKSENGLDVANNSVEEIGYSGDPVVPSIIMRSKKPELYRNGCTQRIHAYEGSFVNGHFPLSGELDGQKYDKATIEDKGEGDERDNPEMNNSSLVDSMLKRKKKTAGYKKRRRRSARYKRSNISALKPIPLLGREALCDFPDSQTCFPDSHDTHESSDNKRKGQHTHSPSTVPSSVSEMGVVPEHHSTAQGNRTEAHIVVNEDTEVASSLISIKQPSGSEDCLDGLTSKRDLEVQDSASVNPDPKQLEDGDTFPSPPPKDRVLKYTFQRKRKRELSSGDDSRLHQEDPLKRKSVTKQNDDVEGSKSGAVAESSRDSRRMAQVARQLLSLSEKKWWK